jgi:hypothetical protein
MMPLAATPNMMYFTADSIWLRWPFALAAHRDHQVEREGGQLEGDDQGDDVDAAHQHHEAGGAQRRGRGNTPAGSRADVRQAAAETARWQTGSRADRHDLEQLGEGVDPVGAGRGQVGVLAQASRAATSGAQRGAERDARRARSPEAIAEGDEEEHEPAGQQHQFGKKSQERERRTVTARAATAAVVPTCCSRWTTAACMTRMNGCGWRPIQRTKSSSGARVTTSRRLRSVRRGGRGCSVPPQATRCSMRSM